MISLPERREVTDKLTPEQYLRYLEGVQLDDILLEAVDASINREVAAEAAQFSLRMDFRCRVAHMDPRAPELLLEYMLRGLSRGRQALRLKATYRLRLATAEPLPIEFLAIYAGSSGYNQAWPFLRELAHSMTMRMGLPPLTLPLRIHDVSVP